MAASNVRAKSSVERSGRAASCTATHSKYAGTCAKALRTLCAREGPPSQRRMRGPFNNSARAPDAVVHAFPSDVAITTISTSRGRRTARSVHAISGLSFSFTNSLLIGAPKRVEAPAAGRMTAIRGIRGLLLRLLRVAQQFPVGQDLLDRLAVDLSGRPQAEEPARRRERVLGVDGEVRVAGQVVARADARPAGDPGDVPAARVVGPVALAGAAVVGREDDDGVVGELRLLQRAPQQAHRAVDGFDRLDLLRRPPALAVAGGVGRSEEHTSELQSQSNLVCRLLLE